MHRDKQKGAILLMVLGMLVLMSFIVSLFLNEIMEDAYLRIQLNGKTQLRHQAYNALNYIISYIEQCFNISQHIDFNTLKEKEIKLKGDTSIKTYVKLIDESGKIPLNKGSVSLRDLKPLFCLFGDIWDGQMLTQAYQHWLQRKPIESKLIEKDDWSLDVKKQKNPEENPQEEQKTINKILFPSNLNTYTQLNEIDKFRTMFFDEKGNPNEKMERLMHCSSLYNVEKININSANKDILDVLSKNFSLDLDQMENYLGLSKDHKEAPKFYRSLKEINTLGHGNLSFETKQGNNMKQKDCRDTLSVETTIVSITITVQEADTSFVLTAVLDYDKQKLTKEKKNGSIYNAEFQIKSLIENYLL